MDTHAFLCFFLLLQGTFFCTGIKFREFEEPETEKTEQEAYDKLLSIEDNMKNLIESLIKQVAPMAIRLGSEVEVSTDCSSSMLKLIGGIRDMKLWALKMVDATAKPSSGGFSGTTAMRGAYQQCLDIIIPGRETDKPPNTGKYCTVGAGLPIPPRTGLVEAFKPVFHQINATFKTEAMMEMSKYMFAMYVTSAKIGICVPSTCTDDDLREVMSLASKKTNLKLKLELCELPSKFTITTTQIILLVGLLISPVLCLVISIYVESAKFRLGKEHAFDKNNHLHKLWKCFSLVDNFQNLMKTRPSEKRTLDSVNGMRYISTTWVILGHTYVILNPLMLSEARNIEKIFDDIFISAIANAFLSVSSFFFITATLISYHIVKTYDDSKFFSPILTVFNRIYRLLPSMLVIVAMLPLLSLVGTGPDFKEVHDELTLNCQENLWAVIFFVTNILPPNYQCMGHFWYISVDMQLVIFALLYFAILFKNEQHGGIFLGFLIVASVVSCGIVTYIMDYTPTYILRYVDVKFLLKYNQYFYSQFYTYLGVYSVGLFLGTYLARNPKVKISRWTNVIGWSVAFCSGVAVVYATYPWNNKVLYSSVEAIVYASTHRTAWAVCLAWVVISCYAGKGGYVNSFLSWPGFQPLGRISYLLYLSHILVMILHEFTQQSTQSATHATMVYNLFGNLCITHILSVFLRLCYEVPIIEVERVIRSRLFSPKKHNKNEKNEISKPTTEDIEIPLEINKEAILISTKEA